MDAPSTSSTPGTQIRQKRVLPSRSRRGGPGVGSCDADVMILETQRRKFENEPLIPAETHFLLTTNPALASTSSSTFEINIHANDRYFERPEVLKAYREQLIIQTPEFLSLGDTPAGRLRARSQAGITEDGPPETSDAAYEKRHRKYETFEKRQRLREKEKLKHEQYKLKERIDQLRAMDASAFLTLPDNLFPAPLDQTDAESDHGEENLLVHHINGGPNYAEGERRRKEMLSVAHILEERYRVLLPPDRMKKAPGQITMEASVEPEVPVYVGKDKHLLEPEEEPIIETVRQETERLKLKIKFPGRLPNPTLPISVSKFASSKKRRQSAPPPSKQPPIRKAKAIQDGAHIRAASPIMVVDLPPASPHVVLPLSSPVPSQNQEYPPSSPPAPHPDQRPVSRFGTPMSNPEIAVLEPGTPETEIVHEEDQVLPSTDFPEPTLASRPRKRIKRSPISFSSPSRHLIREPSVPPIASISAPYRRRSPSHASTVQSSKHVSYAGATGKAERTTSLLMIQAIRSSDSARKAKRHLPPFGGKLRNDAFDEIRDFELPDWIDPPSDTGGLEFPDVYAPLRAIPGARTILSAAEFSKKASHSPTSKANAPS
ncbi:hypothetical protein D9615_001248 [Tricholomella constricta]|uniref:PEHE domain-containing protein n=1 Tax=Tricholomella constricta TaxID=117010 RepID=A0A8H5HL85_9AGAR|nr:hypothetical protein D9615_001248 [Tricholomella constricta]